MIFTNENMQKYLHLVKTAFSQLSSSNEESENYHESYYQSIKYTVENMERQF